MKIALIGYGKMGREIERIALERNHVVVLKIDKPEDWSQLNIIDNVDVAFEFSTPATVLENIEKCFERNIPVVVGTTGWNEHHSEIKERCKDEGKTLFFASNFSIGVNLFFALNRYLAQLMRKHTDYEVFIEETHHEAKLDAPSGTAISLANDIISNLGRKKDWVNQMDTSEGELGIKSIREGQVTGTHSITYESEIDSIEIRHEAKNRKGFAMGAMLAGEWISGKKGFFGMDDLLFGSQIK